jgi:hypothetical protein
MAQLTDREPARTIYHDWWTETRERVRRGRRKERALLEPLIESIEDGWRHVRLLELLYEENQQRARGRDPLGRLLAYIDIDVVDVYRGFVYDLAKLVRCVEAEVTTDCIDSEAFGFDRHVALLHLAAESAALPVDLRERVHAATRPLLEWYAGFEPRIEALGYHTMGPRVRRG